MTTRGFANEESVNKTVEWYTPPWVFEGLGVMFDIDPCASPLKHSPSRHHISLPTDGLNADWGEGMAWVNPPYGPHLPAWMARLKQHGNGIALVFARTDTGWFQDNPPDAALFLKGRIRFIDAATGQPGGSPAAPSFLLAYGPQAVEVLRGCRLEGMLMIYETGRGSGKQTPNLFWGAS